MGTKIIKQALKVNSGTDAIEFYYKFFEKSGMSPSQMISFIRKKNTKLNRNAAAKLTYQLFSMKNAF